MDHETSYKSQDVFIITLILAVLFFLLPLFPQLSHPSFKFAFRSIIFLLLGLCLYRTGMATVLGRLLHWPLFWPMVLVNGFYFVGIFYAPPPYETITKFTDIFTITLLFILLVNAPLSKKRICGLCWALGLGAGLAAALALWTQWVGHDELIRQMAENQIYDEAMRAELARSLEANRAMGRFGNPNHLAGYLVFGLWIVWFLFQENHSKFSRIVLALLGVLLCIGIYFTFSRSGLLALLISLGLMVGIPWLQKRESIPWKPILISLACFAGIVIVAILIAPNSLLGGRLTNISTLVARWHFFRGGFAIIQDYPFLGVGPVGFESYYAQYLRPGDLEARYVHNLLIESAVEGGLVGCILFLWTVFAFFKYFGTIAIFQTRLKVRRNKKRLGGSLALLLNDKQNFDGHSQWIPCTSINNVCIALMGSSITFLLLSMIDFHNNLVEMWVVPAFFTALITQPALSNVSPVPIQKYVKWGVAALLILIWIMFVCCRYQNELAREEGLLLVTDKRYSQAIPAYERAVFFDRTDASSWNSLGNTWANIPTREGQVQRLECLQTAVYWEPRSASFRSDLADALFALGYIDGALQENKMAQFLFPARPVYYLQRARFLEQLGREEEAVRQREIAQDIQEQIEERRL